MLDYANDLTEEIKHAVENGEEELIVSQKDATVLDWLVEQAKRAEMYKHALMLIGAKLEPPASFIANMALLEADQRFDASVTNQTNDVILKEEK